jgi:reverse gyrase
VGYFKTVIKYIIGTDKIDINLNEVEKIVSQVSKAKEGEIVSIAEELKEEGKKEMAKNLLKEGIEVEVIAKSSKLSKEEIKRLQEGMKH